MQIKAQLFYSTEAAEDIRNMGNSLFSNVELALFCFEKFKDPNMRHTLASLDEPIEKYFKSTISEFEKTLHLLQERIDSNSKSLEANKNCDLILVFSDKDLLVVKLREFLKSIVQIASEVSGLETQVIQLEARKRR